MAANDVIFLDSEARVSELLRKSKASNICILVNLKPIHVVVLRKIKRLKVLFSLLEIFIILFLNCKYNCFFVYSCMLCFILDFFIIIYIYFTHFVANNINNSFNLITDALFLVLLFFVCLVFVCVSRLCSLSLSFVCLLVFMWLFCLPHQTLRSDTLSQA